MDFESAAQKACYEKVSAWMKELFGELTWVSPEHPSFALNLGSAVTYIRVFPWGDDDATVTARSYVVSGAELTADLLRFLLEKNNGMRFGAFGLDSDGDIVFDYTVVGSTCDKPELKALALAVAATADKYDDEIVARWGGSRALDRQP